MTPETEALIARLEALHKNASPALFDGTATPRGLGLLLRCGAANQKPRADNWDNLDFEADGKCLLGVAVAAPQLFATIREQAAEIAHLADQLDGCQHNWKQVTAENAKLRAEIERSEALQDLAYIHGAQQYASIAAQSEEAAQAWLLGGCGDRQADAIRALNTRKALGEQP